MINKTVVINEPGAIHASHCTIHPFKRICWTAVFVGALVGVGLGFLLNLFGVAMGLSVVAVNKEGAVALAIGGFIGVAIAVIASMVTAGYAAGYLGRGYCPQRNHGILYGFVTWCVALILSAVVMAHVSQYVSAYAHTIAGTTIMMSADASGVSAVTMASDTSSVDKKQHVTNVVASQGSLACGASLLFALFFIGAVSTCFGASWAMTCQRED
ncbi:MAG: hypothetical protein NTW08_02200 [Gammaproteobacteria bacterium]|nr:hypothetical protein [Gammaproteobacteria bacterium]